MISLKGTQSPKKKKEEYDLKVLIVEPLALPRVAEIEDSLEAMQEVVGGLIEAVYPFEDPVALICNEEGKNLGLMPNRLLMDQEGQIYDVIMGTFFLCSCPPDSENFESLTDEMIEKYQMFYRRIDWIDLFLGLEPQC